MAEDNVRYVNRRLLQ